jgi:hypothetical protein
MDIDATTRDSIFANGLVAVHYPHHKDGKLHHEDLKSTDPAEHDARGKRVLKVLNTLASCGGYVLAEYEGQDQVLIGHVPSKTQIEFLEGKWGDRYNLSGRTAILKTVKMSGVKTVSGRSFTGAARNHVCRVFAPTRSGCRRVAEDAKLTTTSRQHTSGPRHLWANV